MGCYHLLCVCMYVYNMYVVCAYLGTVCVHIGWALVVNSICFIQDCEIRYNRCTHCELKWSSLLRTILDLNCMSSLRRCPQFRDHLFSLQYYTRTQVLSLVQRYISSIQRFVLQRLYYTSRLDTSTCSLHHSSLDAFPVNPSVCPSGCMPAYCSISQYTQST